MASKSGLSVGIDFGCTAFVTLSNGQTFCYPEKLKKMRYEIAKVSGRIRSKTAMGHQGRMKQKLARLRARYAELTNEFIDGLVNKVITRYHFFYVEDIHKEQLLRAGAVKSANRMPWRKFIDALRRECQIREKVFVLVPAKNTSRMCSNCFNIKENLRLSDRVYQCFECGMQKGRDENACHNIERIGKEILDAQTPQKGKRKATSRR
jgi:putative transposase